MGELEERVFLCAYAEILEGYTENGEKDSSEFPFYYAIKLAGIFSWEDKIVEDVEGKISQEGVEMLYSLPEHIFMIC